MLSKKSVTPLKVMNANIEKIKMQYNIGYKNETIFEQTFCFILNENIILEKMESDDKTTIFTLKGIDARKDSTFKQKLIDIGFTRCKIVELAAKRVEYHLANYEIIKNLLPWIVARLAEFKLLHKIKNITGPSTYEMLDKMQNDLKLPQKIDRLEKTLAQLANQYFALAYFTQKFLTLNVSNIVLAYLDQPMMPVELPLELEPKAIPVTVQAHYSPLMEQDAKGQQTVSFDQTAFYMTPRHGVQTIADYLNVMQPGSALVLEQDPYNDASDRKITVLACQNGMFFNRHFKRCYQRELMDLVVKPLEKPERGKRVVRGEPK